MRSINLERAGWASHAVEAFAAQTGAELWQEAIGDLLCDIGHLCDAKGLDFKAIAATSIGVWSVEQEEPEGVSPPYPVSIIISGRKRPTRAWRQSATRSKRARKGRGGAR